MANGAINRAWTAFVQKMKERYQFVVFNQQTLEQTGTYNYTVGKIAALFLLSVCLVGLTTAALFVFTPLNRLLPGYESAESQNRMEEMMRRLSEMQYRVAHQDSQIKSFQRLSGYQVPDSLLAKPGALRDCSAVKPRPVPPRKAEERPLSLPSEKPAPTPETSQGAARTPQSAAPAVRDAPEDFRLFPPVEGLLTRGFDPQNRHFAIDITAPEGTPVRAVADGVVILSEYSLENGHVIAVSHANNYVSFYKHNKVLTRQVGTYVSAGEPIAFVGNSGESTTGPHLHLELWVAGQPVNPSIYFHYRAIDAQPTAMTGYVPALVAAGPVYSRAY